MDLESELNSACAVDKSLGEVLRIVGLPEPRKREPGFVTLAEIINAQQLSTKAAAAIWRRVEQSCRGDVTARKIIKRTPQELRDCGLSRRKVEYIRNLAESIQLKRLNLEGLQNLDDGELVNELMKIRGLGRWSAEIYAMFALGREDLFPAGDLALRIAVQHYSNKNMPMNEQQVRRFATRWSPHRSAVAVLMWRYYGAATLD